MINARYESPVPFAIRRTKLMQNLCPLGRFTLVVKLNVWYCNPAAVAIDSHVKLRVQLPPSPFVLHDITWNCLWNRRVQVHLLFTLNSSVPPWFKWKQSWPIIKLVSIEIFKLWRRLILQNIWLLYPLRILIFLPMLSISNQVVQLLRKSWKINHFVPYETSKFKNL